MTVIFLCCINIIFFCRYHHVQLITDYGNNPCIVILGRSGQNSTMDQCGVFQSLEVHRTQMKMVLVLHMTEILEGYIQYIICTMHLHIIHCNDQ